MNLVYIFIISIMLCGCFNTTNVKDEKPESEDENIIKTLSVSGCDIDNVDIFRNMGKLKVKCK